MTTGAERHERPSAWSKAAAVGTVAGLVGAIGMAMFAMAAGATYLGSGFFTPMYHIASAFGWSQAAEAMMASMQQADAGAAFHWAAAPALVGMIIHMMTGLGWGLLFGLLVAGLRPSRTAVLSLGVGFGIVVLVVMSFVVLPVVATVFGSGDPIRDMPAMVGWGTFTVEHLLFGFLLGLGGLPLASRPTGLRASRPSVSPRTDAPRGTA